MHLMEGNILNFMIFKMHYFMNTLKTILDLLKHEFDQNLTQNPNQLKAT